MTNKKLLTFAAIAIGGYIVWKKFIKEDEPNIAPVQGEGTSNVGGGYPHPREEGKCGPCVPKGDGTYHKECLKEGGARVAVPCTKSISKPRLATARKQTFGSDFNIR